MAQYYIILVTFLLIWQIRKINGKQSEVFPDGLMNPTQILSGGESPFKLNTKLFHESLNINYGHAEYSVSEEQQIEMISRLSEMKQLPPSCTGCSGYLCCKDKKYCARVTTAQEVGTVECINIGNLGNEVREIEYQINNQNGPIKRKLLIFTKGKLVKFHAVDKDLNALYLENELSFTDVIDKFEVFQYFDERHLTSRRILIIFFKSGLNRFIELSFDEAGAIKTGNNCTWTYDGKLSQVFESFGEILIGSKHQNEFVLRKLQVNDKDPGSTFFWQEVLRISSNPLFWTPLHHDGNLYLIFFTLEDLTVYSVNGNELAIEETLKIPDTGTFKTSFTLRVSTNDNDKEMLILLHSEGISVYNFDQLNKFNMYENWKGVFENIWPLHSKDSPSVIFNANSTLGAFKILVPDEAKLQINRNEIYKLYSTKKNLDAQNAVLDSMKERLEKSIFKRSVIEGNIALSDKPHFREPILADQLVGEVTDEMISYYESQIKDILSRLKYIKHITNTIEEKLKDRVLKVGSSRLIKGEKFFFVPKTSVGKLFVENAYISSEGNEKNIDVTFLNLVRRNDSRQMKGRKTFAGKIVVENIRAITVNGEKAENFVTADEEAEVPELIFQNDITVSGDITMGDKSLVHGIDLSKEAVQITGTYSLGKCEFDNLEANAGVWINSHFVNGKNFTEVVNSWLKSNRKTFIPGHAIIRNISVPGNLLPKRIMNVDFKEFLSDVVFKNDSKRAESLKALSVSSEVKCNDVSVRSINGDQYPQDFVYRSDSIVDFGKKSFKKVYFDNVVVNGLVDTLNTSDIVTKSTDQVIHSRKTFSAGAKMLRNLDINSNIMDGIDIRELQGIIDNKNNSNETFIFETSVTATNLTTNGVINGLDLNKIVSDLVYKNDPIAVISSKKIFKGSVSVLNASFETDISGVIPDTLVKTNQQNVIKSSKEFRGNLFFSDLSVSGNVANTNLAELLKNSLRLDKPNQVISGPKIILEISPKILQVTNSIRGIELDSLLTLSSNQTLDGNFEFTNASFNTIHSKLVNTINGKINGMNLKDYSKRKFTPDSFSENLTVHGNVFTKSLNSEVINDFKVQSLYDYVQRDYINTIISSPITFDSLNVVGNINTEDKILADVGRTAINITGANVIPESEWDSLVFEKLNVAGLVNGINLHELESDSIYLDTNAIIAVKGRKKFVHGFNVLGDIDAHRINNVDFRTSLLSRTKPQTITASYTFDNIKAQNILLDKFNDIEIDSLKNLKKSRRLTAKGPLVLEGIIQAISLDVDGLIGNLNLSAILNDVVQVSDANSDITGEKRISEPVHFKNITLSHVNNFDVRDTLSAFHKNVKGDTFIEMVVNGRVTAKEIRTRSLKTVGSLGNLIEDLKEKYQLFEEDSLDHLEFENVVVHGDLKAAMLNGIDPNDYLTKDTNQTIRQSVSTSDSYFRKIKLGGRIGGLLPPKSVQELKMVKVYYYSKSVVVNKSINVNGDLTFEGRFGGKRKLMIPEDIVQLHEDKEIEGNLEFSSPVIVKSVNSTSKLMNDMDLSALNKTYEMMKNLLQNDYGLINPNSISVANYDYSHFINSWKKTYAKECKRLSFFQFYSSKAIATPKCVNLVNSQYFHKPASDLMVDYNHDYPDLRRPSISSPVVLFSVFSNTWLMSSTKRDSCNAELYRWSAKSKTFQLSYTLPDVGNVIQWIVVDKNDKSVTLLSVSDGEGCNQRGSALWKLKESFQYPIKIADLRSAENAFIENNRGTISILLNSGLKTYNSTFKDSIISEGEPIHERLTFSKTFQSGNRHILTRIWNKLRLEIIFEDNSSRVVPDFPVSNGLAVITEENDLIFVLSATIVVTERHYSYIYVLRLQDSGFTVKDSILIESPSKLYSFQVDKGGFIHHFVIKLQPYSTPVIYKLEAKSYLEEWADIPYILEENPWVEQFETIDSYQSESVLNLVFGDHNKIVVVRLQWNGRITTDQLIDCKMSLL